MARDISKIKQLAIQREQSNNPTPHLYAKPQKTISSIRNEQIRHDPGTQIVLDKAKTSKKLSIYIKKKREELKTIAEATKSILAGANSEADRIVEDTKQKASALISQATSDRESAKAILERNKIKEQELKTLGDEVSQRETSVLKREEKVEQDEKVINKDREDVDNLLKTASERDEKSVEIFANTVSLFSLIFEQAKQLQNLNSESTNSVSQTMVKTGRMIERIAVLLKEVDAGNSANIAKAQELQEWQEGLVDRERTLDRAMKEKGQN